METCHVLCVLLESDFHVFCFLQVSEDSLGCGPMFRAWIVHKPCDLRYGECDIGSGSNHGVHERSDKSSVWDVFISLASSESVFGQSCFDSFCDGSAGVATALQFFMLNLPRSFVMYADWSREMCESVFVTFFPNAHSSSPRKDLVVFL